MHPEKYNLNWHTYSDHLREMLNGIMKSEEFTDVTLVCDDKRQFRAHKIVLSACSSVFKSIITEVPQNNQVIYLRGIQHQELKSILEFMYLGMATCHQERMQEFLNVAKDLEIKEICEDIELKDENIIENKSEPLTVPITRTDIDKNDQQNNADSKFNCDQCQSNFTTEGHLDRHMQSKHEGVKYPCNQCDYQATQKIHLKLHIQRKHEGVKYACSQCEYQGGSTSNLRIHIQTKHEGVKYYCDLCNYQLNSKNSLVMHKKANH